MAIIRTPLKGWSDSILDRIESAGGQLEHPSDVKSSTTTGVRGIASGAGGADGPPLCASEYTAETKITTARNPKRRFMRNAPSYKLEMFPRRESVQPRA